MRMTSWVALAALTLLVFPGFASAGGSCDRSDVASHIFDVSDTDRSGTLSRQEYLEAGLERYGVSFEEYDANGDGEASFDEYLDVYDRYHPGVEQIES